jgi:hypothetical protein
VIVLTGAQDWDPVPVRRALADAAGKLWTTSQLGAAWTSATLGGNAIEQLDGLSSLTFAIRGRLLFLSNDSGLLGAVLSRSGASTPIPAFTYAAGFRHAREHANYDRIMTALDFAPAGPRGPGFFSGNIASLSRVLSGISEVRVTEEERGPATMQTVVYQLAQ